MARLDSDREEQRGSDLEFERVHADFRARIRRYLARLAGPGEAEDLTQEAFTRVGQALGSFRGDARLSTWIYRIATNVALDWMRSPSSRRGLAEPLAATTPDVDAGAEERAIREEMGECIRALVDRLPSEYRAVIVLGDLEGLTAREIAEVLGTTVGAAKIKLHRARARLKEALEEGCRLSRDGGGDLGCEPRPLRILSRPPLVNTGREGGLEP